MFGDKYRRCHPRPTSVRSSRNCRYTNSSICRCFAGTGTSPYSRLAANSGQQQLAAQRDRPQQDLQRRHVDEQHRTEQRRQSDCYRRESTQLAGEIGRTRDGQRQTKSAPLSLCSVSILVVTKNAVTKTAVTCRKAPRTPLLISRASVKAISPRNSAKLNAMTRARSTSHNNRLRMPSSTVKEAMLRMVYSGLIKGVGSHGRLQSSGNGCARYLIP